MPNGRARFFIANATETVRAHVDCSVFGVKPEGSLTPVILGNR